MAYSIHYIKVINEMYFTFRLHSRRAVAPNDYWPLAKNKATYPVTEVHNFHSLRSLAVSQAPHGFGAPYRGFPAYLSPSNCLKTARLRRPQFSLCYPLLAIPLRKKVKQVFPYCLL